MEDEEMDYGKNLGFCNIKSNTPQIGPHLQLT